MPSNDAAIRPDLGLMVARLRRRRAAADSADGQNASRMFSEEDHPRVPAGQSGGGRFGAKGEAKKQPAKKPASGDPAPEQETTTPKKGRRRRKVVIPKGSFGYDPASNRGTGYGVKGGDKNVHMLQQALNRLGFTDSRGRKLADDGRLGPLTTAAVKKAQRALGVKADGIVSPAFLKRLVALKSAPKAPAGKRVAAQRRHQIVAEAMRKFDPLQKRDGHGRWSKAGAAAKAIADLFDNPLERHVAYGDGGYVAEHADGSFTIGKPGGGLAAYIVDDDLEELSFALDSATDGIRSGETGRAEGGGWELDWGPDGAVLHGDDENDQPVDTRLSRDDVISMADAVQSVREGRTDDGDGLPARYAALDDDTAENLADLLEGVAITPAGDAAPGEELYSDDEVTVTEIADGGVRLEWADGTNDEFDREQAAALSKLLRRGDDAAERARITAPRISSSTSSRGGARVMARVPSQSRAYTRKRDAEPDAAPERDVTPTAIPLTYRRVFPLEGIEVLSRAKGGDGRTVEAYAAVFGVKTEVHDQHGDYIEENHPTVFNRTISNGAAKRALVLYNHGYDARGKSGGLPTVPLGHPVEIKADKRGLLTVSRYNDSEFTDSVLAAIKNGDIKAQSYEGPIFKSNPMRVPKVARGAQLPLVTRMEMGLRNYGPTPTPYYPDAEITAVRSAAALAEEFARLDEAGREELIRALSTTPGWDPETAHILATPRRGPGAEDSRDAYSVRQKKIRLRAELLARSL